MKKVIFLIAVILIFTTSLIFAEEIRLTTIIPGGSSGTTRTRYLAIGDNYSNATTYPDTLFTNTTTDLIVEGSVGIGTSTPSYSDYGLDVNNSARIRRVLDIGPGDSFANSGPALTVSYSSNMGIIQAANYGSGYSNLALEPYGGNVGIGTTSPTAGKLVVNGTIDVSGNKITSVAIPAGTADAATKGYVDTKCAFTPYAGEQSITFPNGLIIKQGSTTVTINNGTTSVSFAASFPNSCDNMVCSWGPYSTNHTTGDVCQIYSYSKSGFAIYHYGSGTLTVCWIAIGR